MTEQKTEIEPFLAKGRLAVKEGFRAVVAAVVEPYRAEVARTESVPFPEVPKPVVLTKEVQDALIRLKDVFAVVQPTERRTLSDEEKTAVQDERDVLKAIAAMIAARDENLKTIIRTHMDVDAEERGIAVPVALVDRETGQVIVEATERDQNGHYVLCGPQRPERVDIPGTNKEWSREYRAGKVEVNTDPAFLLALYDEGTLTREEYLAMTREVRVFDENKAMDAAATKPDLRDGILKAIHAMTSVGKPGTALFVRNKK